MARKESKIEDFADELGRLLGSAQAKAEGWLGQRTQIAKSLEGIRDTAAKLLTDLGHRAQRMARKGRLAGSKTVAKRGPGRPAAPIARKRRKMSAKARAAISAAQKARWAKLRVAAKKK
jgi:hypothetical protein